jgi:hypothetical protein
MSSERKSITIDSTSLIGGGGGGGGSKRRSKHTTSGSGSGERKIRPSSIVQPSTLKKTLLERIKQHQRTRERSRIQDDRDNQKLGQGNDKDESHRDSKDYSGTGKGDDNFTQSMDFLRKLALKRREQQQHTQKQRRTDSGIGVPEAKTPEAKLLNQVSETLTNGEILTNTGLLGLPVVPMLSTSPNVMMQSFAEPMIQLGSMPMPMQMPMQMPMPMPMMSSMATASAATASETIPNITELADMYNNTIAAASNESMNEASKDPPLHIPQKPEDFLPSIFIKEEPPHGCLKNGTKPTFREWATKMLHKPVDAIKNMLGGSSESSNEVPHPSQDGGASREQSSSDGLNNGSSGINPTQVAGMRVKIRKTKRKRFHIGKHDDVVGVLLKNKQTQRHIQSQHLSLKQKTIGEIRKYLYDHHLLKIGSNAPPDVLRRMYEDAILTGEVKNTNKDVLLHNFMSGGGGGDN